MQRTEYITRAWPDLTPGEMIGRGAYGSVYRARQEDIAVKLIFITLDEAPDGSTAFETDTFSGSLAGLMKPEEEARFLEELAKSCEKEAVSMKSLSGEPNIVQLYDYKLLPLDSGRGYVFLYRMELLKPLGAYFADHEPTEEEVIRIGTDISRALEACEKRRIVHRDIKPENIFVDREGVFKLGDFGVARSLENLSSLYSRQGTANYMAPEVAAMKRYDHRADLYSLGLVLYRLMNGMRLPFMSEKHLFSPSDRSEALTKRLTGRALPAPEAASDPLASVILRACAFEPSDRFSGASDMRKALEALRSPVRRKSGKNLWWIIPGALISAAADIWTVSALLSLFGH